MIKVTIDLKNKQFVGLDGKPFQNNGQFVSSPNEAIANLLYNTVSSDKADKLRNRVWAQELYKTGTLEIDKKGMDAIMEVCLRAGMLDGLYCQLQEWMDEYKEEWDRLKEAEKNAPKAE